MSVLPDVATYNQICFKPNLTMRNYIFSIGGPDGDVAGNEIKILIREYGDNVKIVGISDASGCTEDPDGLNHEEVCFTSIYTSFTKIIFSINLNFVTVHNILSLFVW